jgi:tetratricopeptide (TPR) repeat protein
MTPSRGRQPRGRLGRLWEEARRRKVHRSLTIYGAVVWAAIASAPDLFQYLGVPQWGFPVLLATLALGLPLVVVLSWMFALSFQEEERLEPESERVFTPADVERVGFMARHRSLSWILPLASVGALTLGLQWFLRGGGRSEGLTITLQVAGQGADDMGRSLRQPLEWLLGATVVGRDAESSSPGNALARARRSRTWYLVMAQTIAVEGAPAVSVHLYDTDSAELLRVYSGGGGGESAEMAAGRIALQLCGFLAEREGRDLAVEEAVTAMTSSPLALADLLEGQRRFAVTDFDGAAVALRRAIDEDPDFVPAYYRLAVVERWRWDHAAGLRAVDAALTRSGLPPRWANILHAQRSYLLRDVRDALDGFEEVTLHYPELREGWLGLGEALYHYGGFAGHTPEDAHRALDRALQGKEPFAPMEHHLIELAMWRSDSAAARTALGRLDAAHPVRPALELAFAIRFGTPEERDHAWASLDQHDLRDLSLLVADLAFDPQTHSAADSVAAYLLHPGRPPEDRLRGAQYRLMFASDSADWEARVSSWTSVAGSSEFDPWIIHAHQLGLPAPAAARMLEWAARQVSAGRIPDFRLPLNDDLRRAFNALVHEAVITGDSASVKRLLGAIREGGPADPTDPAPETLSAALRSRLALLAGDTAQAIADLSTATARTTEPFVAFYPLSTMAPERRLLVRLAEATGQVPLAKRWRSSFFHSNSFGDLLYQTWADEVRTADHDRTIPPHRGGPS